MSRHTPHKPTAASGHLWLTVIPLVFVIFWSSGFVVARYVVPYSPPFFFLVIRYGLSIVCFLAWIFWRKVAWPSSPRQWGHLLVIGVLMHVAYVGPVWTAVRFGMGAGMVALILGLQPLITAIWLSWREKQSANGEGVSARQWLGLLLGLLGILLVLWNKLMLGSTFDHVTPLALFLTLLGLASITSGTLYQKYFVAPCDVRTASVVQLLAALAVSFVFSFFESGAVHWNAHLFGAIAWAVLVLTISGSSLFYLLIARGSAARVTSLLYLVPPTTAIAAWLMFDEVITLLVFVGTAFTALGVTLVLRAPRGAKTSRH